MNSEIKVQLSKHFNLVTKKENYRCMRVFVLSTEEARTVAEGNFIHDLPGECVPTSTLEFMSRFRNGSKFLHGVEYGLYPVSENTIELLVLKPARIETSPARIYPAKKAKKTTR